MLCCFAPRVYNHGSVNMFKFFSKLLDLNQKEVDRLQIKVDRVNSLSDKFKSLKKPEDFSAVTAEFRQRLAEGSDLDSLLPEAFAVVREASDRAVGLRPYGVQLMSAIAFHEGKVSEQKTGEGKTLSAVPALYLNALTGKGVHLVTVNDYLARRDAGWNGPTFHLLGLTVGVIVHEASFIYDPAYFDPSHGDDRLAHLKPCSRKEAYAADITYGTNNEFGFDYLRDNMVGSKEDCSQRGHNFAIVDEVDSILIDEARTPLIISQPDTEPTQKYYEFAKLVSRLESSDFVVDEKHRTANLTEEGLKKVEKMLGVENLYERDFETIHLVENALKARTLFIQDKDYIIRDNQVIIVDEFTGRLMPGRRWSDGIHQSVEAKENVPIQQESKTMATISFQNYFRLYQKLAGMTGTAATEAEELRKIYKLDVVVIPTHKKSARTDHSDIIYKNSKAKLEALAAEIAEIHKKGQPVLVGTTSIDKNQIVSDFLKKKGVPHQLLNAKNHEKEATIIAEAGRKGAVTIATNIAGRGVDIILGGTPPPNPKFVLGKDKLTPTQYEKSQAKWKKDHDEVVSLGGLFVIGTERHESRRIDNQLRGRSGRQGDPGATKFYLALDDEIMRIFGGDQVVKIMNFLKIPDNEPIEHSMVSKAIEQAQVKVEGFNFDARKNVVEYDDVMNKQREIVYGLRHRVLNDEITNLEIIEKFQKSLKNTVTIYAPRGVVESEVTPILTAVADIVPFDDTSQKSLSLEISRRATAGEITNLTDQIIKDAVTERHNQVGDTAWQMTVRFSYLSSIDNLWVEHLDAIDHMRSGIGLRSYGQRDPLVEYKSEAFSMFERLIVQIESEFSKRLLRAQFTGPNIQPAKTNAIEIKPAFELPSTQSASNLPVTSKPMENIMQAIGNLGKSGDKQKPSQSNSDFMSAFTSLEKTSVKKDHKEIGRNDPCWCGSGKKYKRCHFPN